MINRILKLAVGAMLGQLLKDRIRDGSIQAVKAYIQVVRGARGLVIGLAVLGIASSILVAGIVLVVVGLVGLLPIEPNIVALVLIGFGVVLAAVAATAAALFFSEKRWLEVSKAYDLMDAALNPWEGVLPPNPIDVMRTAKVDPAPRQDIDAIDNERSKIETTVKNAVKKVEGTVAAEAEKIKASTSADRGSLHPSGSASRPEDYSRPVFAPGH